MSQSSPLISISSKGLYCAPADVYIDPWRPVNKALITHGHSDHARWGHKKYLAHQHTVAMHHGSISREQRQWVEEALHEGKLKAVVCTSSLDLGVDFRPVDTVIQVGGPKGVARFAQRAGRSGHLPGALSKIYFVPTHSLELVEASALRSSLEQGEIEHRKPYILSFDVLIQYIVTLSLSEGFAPGELFNEVRTTYAYRYLTPDQWHWCLDFVSTGGKSLFAYEEHHKIVLEGGKYFVKDKRTALRHRLSIGTIVSDTSLRVKYLKGSYLGTVEEWFISKLKVGDVFWFAGRSLELYMIKDNDVLVKKTNKKTGKVPAWMGGRMPLSSMMSSMLRDKLTQAHEGNLQDRELAALAPLLRKQAQVSLVPREDQLLIETAETREGHHLFVYPFEGRFVHEAIASILAYRMSLLTPISFSIAFTDYGFELLSDQPIPIQEALDNDFFTSDRLLDDLQAGLNSAEMARRKFRDIASIAGLVFTGFPGKRKKDRHLQSSSQLLFSVFADHEPNNLLLEQAYREVFDFQLEEDRLRKALDRINNQEIVLVDMSAPSPFAFPILVDRIREKMSSESLEDRVKKMQLQLENA